MTASPRGAGSPSILDGIAYPMYQFDVEKSGVGRFQFWVSTYYGNPYNPTKSAVIQRIADKFVADGFTLHSVTLYEEYSDNSPL